MGGDEHSVARLISILYRYGQCHIGKKLEHHNIGSGQYGILLTLFRKGGVSQEELACYLKIDKGSIAKSIKKLEDDAYVYRSVDEADKRAYKVFLTQKAMDVIPEVQEAIDNWEKVLLSGLSGEEKQSAEQLLNKMARSVHDMKPKSGENGQ